MVLRYHKKNQATDSFLSLQVSQHFRASDKYSYGSYKQLRLIFDKLESSQILYQIPLLVAKLVAADSGKTLFQITADKILPDDIGDDRSEIPVCPGAEWAAGSPGNAQSGGKTPTFVISTVTGRIFHVAVLQARLPF